MAQMIIQSSHLLLICSPELPFLVLGLLFYNEGIFFLMVGLPLFGKENPETPVLFLVKALLINEPQHELSNNVRAVCATSKCSDQSAHTRSLIRAFDDGWYFSFLFKL